MKIIKTISLITVLVFATSCLGKFVTNDNAELYGTEWSDSDQTEGLKFLKGDSVVYFSPYCRATAHFDYDKSTGNIVFDDIVANYTNFTAIITNATIKGNTIYVAWHKLGGADNYYMTFTRRR